MLPALLRFEDRNSMAFSTETRLPFLDYRLVEHAISLSPGLKIRDGWTKWALRSAIDDIVPEEIAWRRRKIGFEAPTEMWVSYHQDVMVETIRSSGLLGRFCDMNHLLKSFGRLAPNHQWRLYGLAEWEKCFSVNC
jgi:asparagine synthase (glutamine-hydrolysing)